MINQIFKDRFNNQVTITINGTTPAIKEDHPAPFIIKDIIINCNNSDLKPSVRIYNGSITFLGSYNNYKEFQNITFLSHPITITTQGYTFQCFLLPEIYNMDYTGMTVSFSLNFESILGKLEREIWNEPTNLYSIQDILNKIQTLTGCTLNISTSFSNSLSNIKIYSANFTSDENLNENYMKILHWIQTTFGFNIILIGTTLFITSCEKDFDPSNVFPNERVGINETVSVNKQIDTCQVLVNNYELPIIPTNFDLEGAIKLLDVTSLQCKRGYRFPQSRDEKFYIYYRQIYEYQPNQKEWHFHKYNTSGIEVDEFDENIYITNTGEPMCGAYPVACGSDFWGKDEFATMQGGQLEPLKKYIWFKFHQGNYKLPSNIANKMMSIHKENFLVPPNTFMFMNLNYLWYRKPNNQDGSVSSITTNWANGYDDTFNPSYSSNLNLAPIIMRRLCPDIRLSGQILGITIKWTDLNGVESWWNGNGQNVQWQSAQYVNNISNALSDAVDAWIWTDINQLQVPPRLADGSIAYFEDFTPRGFWVRFPEVMGTLDISIGAFGGGIYTSYIGNILLQPDIQIVQMQHYETENIDLSKHDVIYSNTTNTETDQEDIFYMYTHNEYWGRGVLYNQTADNPLDTLSYPYGQDKPEWNYISIMTQLFSKQEVFTDMIKINDFKPKYSDRFILNYEINPLTGVTNITTCKPKTYNLTAIPS